MHIYWFKDSKAGHLKQVNVLLNRLKQELKFSLISIDLSKGKNSLRDIKSIASSINEANQPVIFIGAGHSVYSKIVDSKKILKKNFNKQAISIAILRPSSNIKSFDLICAPKHDFNNRKVPDNVITFQGALASPSYTPVDKNKGVIAIGGHSKHYKFNEEILMKHLHYILSVHPNYEFKIFNSRRTPNSINLNIKDEISKYENVHFIDFHDPLSNSFEDNIQKSALKFVTPDSANLVFEALSSKGNTYLIQIENPKYRKIFGSKKIRNSINELIESKRVGLVYYIQKEGMDISKIENPSEDFEPLAEVEKIACSIKKFLNSNQ
tara:strand:- start:2331 stop:3299 length:969 start_codon:yes stop_codon:yes gene_type:complete